MRDMARVCNAIDSSCERDHHVPRLSWSTKMARGYSSLTLAMITAETGWCSRPGENKSVLERPETTRGPMSFLWCQTDMERPWNIEYSGKKRKKRRERKRILRDYLLRWEWLKSLELAQLSVLLSEEMGSWEVNLISAADKENSIPEHPDSCTVPILITPHLIPNYMYFVLYMHLIVQITNSEKEKERHIFWSLCEGSPTILLSECMSLLYVSWHVWISHCLALINFWGLRIEWKSHQTERDSIAGET